ncbi:hypothetical protein ACOI1H_13540 [Loktanella sp. DJP18]|uniref:hypothetical protein n=1 Tax=Loktanella sp. DJP18 TaxID=3409788 RepID=UPI003BB56841
MFDIAQDLAAAIVTAVPAMSVATEDFNLSTRPSVADGPALVIACNDAHLVRIAVHIDECDELNTLIGHVYRAARAAASDMHSDLAFLRAEPILDDSDFRIGERMFFQAKLRSDALHQSKAA